MGDRVSGDTLFAGTLRLFQPTLGHRIGTDAVLLAAACPGDARFVVDLGCGAGAVGLRTAQVLSQAHVTLVDVDPAILAIAARNIAANGLDDRCRTVLADAMARSFPPEGSALAVAADVVLTNPPYAEPGQGSASPDGDRARAHVLAGSLDQWVKAALACLAPRGQLVMIHRADALPAVLAALDRRFGDIRIRPVHPRADRPASRILVCAKKAARTPPSLLPPLVLHTDGGAFTAEAAALHEGATALAW